MFGIGSPEVIFLIIIVCGIMMLLVPFFIFRIRNEVIKIRELLTKIVEEGEFPKSGGSGLNP